jgi:predicted RNase H-like HicB family nuclease
MATMHDDRCRIDLFWSDEDEAWVANVPDLKYCSAHGDTPEEALAEVQIAKGLWLEIARERGWLLPMSTFPVSDKPKSIVCMHHCVVGTTVS